MHGSSFDRDSRPAHQLFFDPSASDQPLNAIITALTTVMDCSPTEVTALYETVDVGALERLLEHAATTAADPASVALGFAVESWDVVITGDGRLRLYGRDGTEPSEPASELECERDRS